MVPIEPEPTAPPTVGTNGAPPAEQQFTHIMPNQQFNIDKTKERYTFRLPPKNSIKNVFSVILTPSNGAQGDNYYSGQQS